MKKSKKVWTAVLAWGGGILLLGALGGGYALKGAINLINRDKMFLMDSIPLSFQSGKLGPELIEKLVPEMVAKYGKFLSITKVDGVPVLSDTLKGGKEFSFQVSANFEKGPITFDARVSNEGDKPELMKIYYREGHFERQRVRNAIVKAVRD
jgi:hypothetical protein